MKNSNKKGFTLVELVVVIAIIGVLAAILVPSLLGYVKKSRLSTANANAKSVYNAISAALADEETKGNTLTNTISNTLNLGAGTGNQAVTSAVEAAAKNAIDGSNAGQAWYECKKADGSGSGDNKYTVHIQWHKKTGDTMVGQYPDAPDSVKHAESLKFGTYNETPNK